MDPKTTTTQDKRIFDPKEIAKVLTPAASLTFHKVLFYDYFWYPIYFIIMFICFYFKREVLTYPIVYFQVEVILLACSLLIKFMKIFNGIKGNKREMSSYVIFAIVFSLGGVLSSLYFMIFQIFVLQLEWVINFVNVVFEGLSLVCAILAYLSVSSAESDK